LTEGGSDAPRSFIVLYIPTIKKTPGTAEEDAGGTPEAVWMLWKREKPIFSYRESNRVYPVIQKFI
jgi:hypothetical protein